MAASAFLKSPWYSSLSLMSPCCQVQSIVSRLFGVLGQKEALPEGDQEVFQRRIAQPLQIELRAIEGLRKAPAGIDTGHRAQSLVRFIRVPALVPCGIGGQRRLHPLEEDEIMARAFRRAAERQDALDHIRIERSPVKGLQGAHRPSGYQLDLVDAEFLGHQPVLCPHIVVGRDLREPRPVIGLRRIARRRRQAVAEHIGDDDEVFPRIERHPRPDQPLVVVVLARVPGRIDDDIALVRALSLPKVL